MEINRNLLPMKGHFFLFNAGTAPLVPYLSTYAKQLGFSSSTVGLIYTILPICGLIAKPLFGAIADRYKIQKLLFILFQVVTAIAFLGIYFIPETENITTVELSCGEGETFLKTCYDTKESINSCQVNALIEQNGYAACEMRCHINSSSMLQTICEHWHIPQYCYGNVSSFEFSSYINSTKLVNANCVNLYSDMVMLDGKTFIPHCHITDGHVNTNESCSLNCPKETIFSIINNEKTNMTCLENSTYYTICRSNSSELKQFENMDKNSSVKCEAKCDIDKAWSLMEICEGWQADSASTCQLKTQGGDEFPETLAFQGIIKLSKTITEHECIYLKLQEIILNDGSVHYPTCPSHIAYEKNKTLFDTSCTISCNNSELNDVLNNVLETRGDKDPSFTRQFWLFFFLMIASWVGMAVVVSIADAICFNILGDKPSDYGRQRLWGSVGWGVVSLITGSLIDRFSEGAVKNYTVAFVLMFIFLSFDAVVSLLLKYKETKLSFSIIGDIRLFLSSWHTFAFLLWTVAVGMCTGLLWQFLFWHLEDISCEQTQLTKTLQGLVSAIQCFGGEIPFMFLSGPILKKIGHVHSMTLVLLAFGMRFILYSWLYNPWWVLPIELLQGVTFGMFYPTMTSYASIVAPPGTETTVQGLVGAIFEGVGTSLGSFIGGRLYGVHGGWNTFRWFGCGALVLCLIHAVGQCILGKKSTKDGLQQGKILHYKTEGNEDENEAF